MSRTPSLDALTVDALVRYGPLATATPLIEEHFDRPVPHVALVSELDDIRGCAAHTAVVLHPVLTHGVWAVESALRLSWERAASCVVTPGLPGIGESTAQLAKRLRMPVFVVPDDSARCALDLAAAVANPESVRAKVIAQCAMLFGERSTARGILGVINTEVPGVEVALVAEDGAVLAGRTAAATAGGDQVRVEVAGPDGKPWARMVASLVQGGHVRETVRSILRLARAPLVASVARERLEVVHRSARAGAALDVLLGAEARGEQSLLGPSGLEAEAVTELGWQPADLPIAVFLRAATEAGPDVPTVTPGVMSAWQQVFGDRPLVPRAAGWASWWSGTSCSPEEVRDRLRRGLSRMRSPIALVGGVGTVGEQPGSLRTSLVQAELASAGARGQSVGHVELFTELGERLVLACLPLAELARSAEVALAELLAASDRETLVETLRAVLDSGGSTGQAATRLRVHRNTVLGRLERIRGYGIDPDSADGRLALHLAAYALSTHGPAPAR
ncbi:PucR-like helix-turn-helix protein [Tamaricihabitans halophyticus]|uniref:PucR-like helix-turn-helix protein n=1 Tax=Tamaricihabitans halophyticus TaxID=1262583 RepID=A0A4R2QY78_9PSEU|nr:helix-turn-helix domain-containing protein [Tamaricihabitans halophyticus]TCP55133.1 PucR-like helix-turn-helix protein [Tamaricihabitans halophyticus]